MRKSYTPEPQFPTVSSPATQSPNNMLAVIAAREIQEVQGAIISAKHFPRDQNAAYERIIQACKRQSLAEVSSYAFPKGGQTVTGPSIRLAEVLAQNWGNMQFGIRELRRDEEGSHMEAYAWDIETNTRRANAFVVPHERNTKKGTYKLTDNREIYEMNANLGSRRLRGCILAIIPGDIVQAAVDQCEKTLEKGGGTPIKDRIRNMVVAFADQGVNQKMIEKRLGHKIDVTTEAELVRLQQIYRSLKDEMAKRDDFFEFETDEATTVRDVNQAATANVEAVRRENAFAALENKLEQLGLQEISDAEIASYLGLPSLAGIAEWPIERIESALEALHDFNSRSK